MQATTTKAQAHKNKGRTETGVTFAVERRKAFEYVEETVHRLIKACYSRYSQSPKKLRGSWQATGLAAARMRGRGWANRGLAAAP